MDYKKAQEEYKFKRFGKTGAIYKVLDGDKILGFETLYGLAEKKDTGVETIFALCKMHDVPTVLINNKVCIPVFAIEQFQ